MHRTVYGTERQGLILVTDNACIRKRSLIVVIVFALAFALSWTLPQYSDSASLFSCIALALFLVVPVGALSFGLWTALSRLSLAPVQPECRWFSKLLHPLKGRTAFATPLFLGLLAFLLAEWAIFFLGLYPGITSTDSIDIFKMAMGLPFESDHFRYDTLNSHHPILYTASVTSILNAGAFLSLGEMEQVALVSLFHLIFLALCCAWCAAKLVILSRSKGMLAFCIIFLAFDPLLGFYAVSIWKDVIFAAVLFVLGVRLVEYLLVPYTLRGAPTRIISLICILLACALLRSNGIFIIGCTLIGALVVLRKKRAIMKTVSIVSLSVLVAWTCVMGPLSSLAQIQSGHFAESISIPIQQIGRSLAEGAILEEEDRHFLDQILPLEEWENLYLPEGPNPIKFAPAFNDEYLEAHKAQFIGTWLWIGIKNPGAYLRAWIDQTEAFWNIQATTWYVGTPGYSLTGDEWASACKLGILGPERLDAILNTVMSAFAPLFNIAVLAWMVIFLAVHAFAERQWNELLCLIPLLSLWVCFLLAAPMNDFRYFFPVHLALPLLMFLAFCPAIRSGFAEPEDRR